MLVSVIVPVRNEAASLRETLLDLGRQDFPIAEFEILVVDGLSDDGTADIVRDLQATLPNLHLFENPQRLASAARNVGVRHAVGDFLVIVDGHCRVRDARFLQRLVRAFESTGADSLGRPQPLRATGSTPFQQAVAAARNSWLGHNPDSAAFANVAGFVPADNVAVAYRRDVFDLMGGFDESFDACEDVEFNTRVRRVGLSCFFEPGVAVEYEPRRSVRTLALQMVRYGRGRARLAMKHPTSVTPASLVPAAWLMWLAFGFGLSTLQVELAWLPLSSLGAYLAAVLAESARVSVASRALFLRLPLVFATIHAAFGWGYLREILAVVPTLRTHKWLRRLRHSIGR